MEIRPNDYDGFSYFIKQPSDIDNLDSHASILLEPGQIGFFKNYPNSLEGLVKRAASLKAIPNLAKWLASLWNKPLTLEVHTTSDLYHLNAVWLRFDVQKADPDEGQPAWKPALNLLGLRNHQGFRVPDLLSQVLHITGEINHNGYGVAGRLHHPERVGDEVTFYETLYNDKALYELPDLTLYWEFHGGKYGSEEERKEFGLYRFDQGWDIFLNLYFGVLVAKKELRINRQGEPIA